MLFLAIRIVIGARSIFSRRLYYLRTLAVDRAKPLCVTDLSYFFFVKPIFWKVFEARRHSRNIATARGRFSRKTWRAKRRIFASLSNDEIFRDISLTYVTSSFRNYKKISKKQQVRWSIGTLTPHSVKTCWSDIVGRRLYDPRFRNSCSVNGPWLPSKLHNSCIMNRQTHQACSVRLLCAKVHNILSFQRKWVMPRCWSYWSKLQRS